MMSMMQFCRKCGSPNCLPSVRRNTLERLLSAFIVACECHDCGSWFYASKWNKPDPAGARELRWYPRNP